MILAVVMALLKSKKLHGMLMQLLCVLCVTVSYCFIILKLSSFFALLFIFTIYIPALNLPVARVVVWLVLLVCITLRP